MSLFLRLAVTKLLYFYEEFICHWFSRVHLNLTIAVRSHSKYTKFSINRSYDLIPGHRLCQWFPLHLPWPQLLLRLCEKGIISSALHSRKARGHDFSNYSWSRSVLGWNVFELAYILFDIPAFVSLLYSELNYAGDMSLLVKKALDPIELWLLLLIAWSLWTTIAVNRWCRLLYGVCYIDLHVVIGRMVGCDSAKSRPNGRCSFRRAPKRLLYLYAKC